jgi:hypothetical protein
MFSSGLIRVFQYSSQFSMSKEAGCMLLKTNPGLELKKVSAGCPQKKFLSGATAATLYSNLCW